ncbi:MAG: hypothetical protein QXP81_02035 [Nitrososphaerota archaeon]
MSSKADLFERAARRNGISVLRVHRRDELVDAIASLAKGGDPVVLGGELSWLEHHLGRRGLRAVLVDEAEPVELLSRPGAVAVRSASGAFPETGSVLLAGSFRVQLITSLSERLLVLLDTDLLERGIRVGDLLRSAVRRGGPLYVISGPSSTRDIEHLSVIGATGPREVACLLVQVGEPWVSIAP